MTNIWTPKVWQNKGVTVGDPGSELNYLAAIEATWAVCQPIMTGFVEGDGDKATPCAEFTVDQLSDHLMGSLRSLGGMAGAEFPESFEASSLEDSVSQASAITIAAWNKRGTDGEVQFFENMVPAVDDPLTRLMAFTGRQT